MPWWSKCKRITENVKLSWKRCSKKRINSLPSSRGISMKIPQRLFSLWSKFCKIKDLWPRMKWKTSCRPFKKSQIRLRKGWLQCLQLIELSLSSRSYWRDSSMKIVNSKVRCLLGKTLLHSHSTKKALSMQQPWWKSEKTRKKPIASSKCNHTK